MLLVLLVSGAAYETLKQGGHEIFPAHLLLSLVRHEKSVAAELLRDRQLDYDRLVALMREQHIIFEQTETVLPRMEDLLGPLGEQLTRLYSDVQSDNHYLS